MDKKYEMLKDDTIEVGIRILHRIKALKDFNDVRKGDLGGYIEKEENLSHEGNCWIYDNANVFDNAWVFGDAQVYGDACVSNNAKVCDNTQVFGDARVFGDAKVYGDAQVFGDACVSNNAQVFDDAWVFGDAQVFGNACVSNNAQVFGNACVSNNAQVFGDACVSNNAHITNINDYIVIGPIGSRDDYTTFYLTKDKEIMVSCGCFNDTIDEFIKAVNETHRDNDKYKNDYNTVSECVKMLLK